MRAAAALVVLGIVAAAAPARGGEPADRGISMSAWAGAAVDRSVAAVDTGQLLREGAPLVGATTLGNIGRLAMGGAVDATPGINGDGRMSLALLLGVQPEVEGTRIQLLGEAGRHRFSNVGGSLSGHQLGPDTWLPYLGVRVGVARTAPAHGPFEVGAWLFGRYDVGEAIVTNIGTFMQENRTDYRLGGWMCGLALRVGLHLEAADPRRTEEMMARAFALVRPLQSWSSWKRHQHGRFWWQPTSPKEATRRSIARLRWPSSRRRRSRSSTSSSWRRSSRWGRSISTPT